MSGQPSWNFFLFYTLLFSLFFPCWNVVVNVRDVCRIFCYYQQQIYCFARPEVTKWWWRIPFRIGRSHRTQEQQQLGNHGLVTCPHGDVPGLHPLLYTVTSKQRSKITGTLCRFLFISYPFLHHLQCLSVHVPNR